MADAYPVLYVIVRPLQSMNGGKAQAHSGHAASQFVFCGMNDNSKPEGFVEWCGALGFGTQINLKARNDEHFFAFADAFAGYLNDTVYSGVVIDPTYPYMVNEEIYSLIPDSRHTEPARFNEETGIYTCFREEVTAAWAFGMSDNSILRNVTRRYELHP